MEKRYFTKTSSLLIVVAVYIVAFIAAAVIFRLFRSSGVLLATLIADVIATLVVWGAGLIFKNASLYDPYWSVIPMFVIPFWVIINDMTGPRPVDTLVSMAVIVWGIRLTANWAIGWKGLEQQDWRYTMLKEKNPDIWFITNLGGINMMPTLFVFLGMVPAYFMIYAPQRMTVLGIFGFIICWAASTFQLIADKQMHDFRKISENSEECINTGLWKYSRHPNYLGEIMFWWGIWIMMMGTVPQYWYTAAGPLAITILFVFISIPMMEKHVLLKRPSYAAYKKSVPMLLPFPKK